MWRKTVKAGPSSPTTPFSLLSPSINATSSRHGMGVGIVVSSATGIVIGVTAVVGNVGMI